ncbi:MAG: RNA polymerase sigma factor [Cellulosilyticaceae bacterium]
MERLKELYEDKAEHLKQYLIKRGAAPEDAEEIVQNTFVKAIEYDVHLLEHGSAWLFKVALNQFYDLCRRGQRHPMVMIDDEALYAQLRDAGVEEVIVSQEMGDALRTTLGQLSETYQNLLLLKYEMGLSYEEMSRLLGMKTETIKTYLYRARERFKDKWRARDGR